jgi:hypothetical protein
LEINPDILGVVGNNLSDILRHLSSAPPQAVKLANIALVATAMENALSFIRRCKISIGAHPALPVGSALDNLGGGGGKKEVLETLFIPNNMADVNQICWSLASDSKQSKFHLMPPIFSRLDIQDLPVFITSISLVPGLVAIPSIKKQDWIARVKGYGYTRALYSYLHTATAGDTAILSHYEPPGGCVLVFDQSSSHLMVEYKVEAKCSLVLCLCSETKGKLNAFKLNDLLTKLEQGRMTIENLELLLVNTPPTSLFQKLFLKDEVVFFSKCFHSRVYRNIMRKLLEPHRIPNFVTTHLQRLEKIDEVVKNLNSDAIKAALVFQAEVDQAAMRERKAAALERAQEDLLQRRATAGTDLMADPLNSKVNNGLLWGMCSKCKKWRKMWDGMQVNDLKGLWTCAQRLDIDCNSPEEPNDGSPLSMDLALKLARESALEAVLAATEAGGRSDLAKELKCAIAAPGPAGKRLREVSGKAGGGTGEEGLVLPEKSFSPLAFIRPRPGPFGKSGRFTAVVQTGGPFSVTSLAVVNTGGGATRCSLHTSGHMCACASLLSRCLDAKNEVDPPPLPTRTGTHGDALAFEPQSYIRRAIQEVGRRQGIDNVVRHNSGPCSNCTPCLHTISTTAMAPPSQFNVTVALTLQHVPSGGDGGRGGGGGEQEGGGGCDGGGEAAPTQFLAFDSLPPHESMEDSTSLGKFPLHCLIAGPSASSSTTSTFSIHCTTHNGRTRLQVSLSGGGDAQVKSDIVLTTEEPSASLSFRTNM